MEFPLLNPRGFGENSRVVSTGESPVMVTHLLHPYKCSLITLLFIPSDRSILCFQIYLQTILSVFIFSSIILHLCKQLCFTWLTSTQASMAYTSTKTHTTKVHSTFSSATHTPAPVLAMHSPHTHPYTFWNILFYSKYHLLSHCPHSNKR